MSLSRFVRKQTAKLFGYGATFCINKEDIKKKYEYFTRLHKTSAHDIFFSQYDHSTDFSSIRRTGNLVGVMGGIGGGMIGMGVGITFSTLTCMAFSPMFGTGLGAIILFGYSAGAGIITFIMSGALAIPMGFTKARDAYLMWDTTKQYGKTKNFKTISEIRTLKDAIDGAMVEYDRSEQQSQFQKQELIPDIEIRDFDA